MTTPSLKIAGYELSPIALLDFDQQIEPFGGSTTRRLSNGAAFKMTGWRKHRISLSASGWVPAALNGVDYSAPFEVELPLPIALRVGEPLPDGFTARSTPWSEHTVTDQAGISVRYVYVKVTVISDGPRQSHNLSATPSWELTLEQA